jgi:hypothetical protein
MTITQSSHHGGLPWRPIGWGGIAFLLLLPLVTDAPWTLFDYVIMGVMLGGAGLVIELIIRSSTDRFYRAGAGLAVLAAFLLLWVNGAVGFLGNEDNPANLLFLGVIAIAVVGAVLGTFRAAAMARAMFSAAAAQLLVGAAALAFGLGSPGNEGLYEAVLGTALFGLLWLISGALFRKAATNEAKSAVKS